MKIRKILIFLILLSSSIVLSAAPIHKHKKIPHHPHSKLHHKKHYVYKHLNNRKPVHPLVLKNNLPNRVVPTSHSVTQNNIALERPTPPVVHYSLLHRSWLNAKQNLVGLVHKTVSTLHFSRYKLGGTYFNQLKGVYLVDCSDYVDHLLHNANPRAYFSLLNVSRTEKPTSLDYYDLFSALPDETWRDWQRVNNINELEAGDILVFRFKNLEGRRAAGHVMIVMNPPIIQRPNIFAVRVSDSAPSGHSSDTRPPHKSGIGIGTLFIKVDPDTERPYAYAWKYGAPWRTDSNFAMGRPMSEAT